MSAEDDIPMLTDLIESGGADDEIRISDLGLDDAEAFPSVRPGDPFGDNPALEQAVRRILDEHMKLAWQEIKILLKRELKKP